MIQASAPSLYNVYRRYDTNIHLAKIMFMCDGTTIKAGSDFVMSAGLLEGIDFHIPQSWNCMGNHQSYWKHCIKCQQSCACSHTYVSIYP